MKDFCPKRTNFFRNLIACVEMAKYVGMPMGPKWLGTDSPRQIINVSLGVIFVGHIQLEACAHVHLLCTPMAAYKSPRYPVRSASTSTSYQLSTLWYLFAPPHTHYLRACGKKSRHIFLAGNMEMRKCGNFLWTSTDRSHTGNTNHLPRLRVRAAPCLCVFIHTTMGWDRSLTNTTSYVLSLLFLFVITRDVTFFAIENSKLFVLALLVYITGTSTCYSHVYSICFGLFFHCLWKRKTYDLIKIETNDNGEFFFWITPIVCRPSNLRTAHR